jgi:hypothetical protein
MHIAVVIVDLPALNKDSLRAIRCHRQLSRPSAILQIKYATGGMAGQITDKLR